MMNDKVQGEKEMTNADDTRLAEPDTEEEEARAFIAFTTSASQKEHLRSRAKKHSGRTVSAVLRELVDADIQNSQIASV